MKYKVLQVTEEVDGEFKRTIVELDIPKPKVGEVLIEVKYSSLNYKDFLSATGNKGVTRKYPHVPGIDAAGEVVISQDPGFKTGDEVIVTGYDLGMNTDGGFGKMILVPATWVVNKPVTLSLEEAMIYGTAGFTAAQCVEAVLDSAEKNMVDLNTLPIAVTGAGGGVGSVAAAVLVKLGFTVTALTRNPHDDFFKTNAIGNPASLTEWQKGLDEKKPLLKPQWSSAVDTVGGGVLADLIRTCDYRGAISCCGMVGGITLNTNVFPFILKGVRLVGIDSAECPMPLRKKIWEKLGSDWKLSNLHKLKTVITFDKLEETLLLMKEGKTQGRVVLQHD